MNIFSNNPGFSRKALSATLFLAIVFSMFQPFVVFAATPAVTPDVITNIQTITTPGSSSWVVPAGVTEIRVKVWGAGGSAGNGSSASGHVLGGGGGGGAGYAERDIVVTPGESFTAVVGRGGVSSEEGVGRSGQISSFASSTVLVSASGGNAGKRGAEVQAPVPTISLSATPGRFNSGESTRITWSTTNADSCVASGMITGTKPADGSQSVTRTSSGTATFSCTGLGGTAVASVSVVVDNCGPRGGCYTGPDFTTTGESSAGTTDVITNPLALAAAGFNGSAGVGLVGSILESGVSATDISFNASGNIDSTNGGAGARGGAGGLRSTTVAGADGVSPAAGGGGSDVTTGGNGAHGQIVIESIVRGGPVVTNGAPSVPTVVGPTAGDTTVSYSFSAVSTDPEGDVVRYGFDWDNDGTIDQYTAFGTSGVATSTTHTWGSEGSYTFKVYAEDASGNRSLPASHTIVISTCGPRGGCFPGNLAPTGFTFVGPTSGTVNVSYTFTAGATDPEGDAIRYGIDWDNNGTIEEYTAFGASGVSTTTSHSWTAAGTYDFKAYAEDVNGNRTSAITHTIVISNGGGSGNSAPVGLSVSGPTVGTTSVSYIFTAAATDPESSSLRYGFDWNNDGTIDEYTSLVASGVASSTSHVWPTAGTYTFSVYAEDVAGARSAAVTHTIVINNAVIAGNNAPVVTSVTGTTTPTANTAYSFTATATDADGDSIQYGFDWNNNGIIDAGEPWTPLTISGVSASQSNSWGVSGAQSFNVFARDSRGATSTPRSFSVTVSGGLTNVGFAISTSTGLTTSEAGATASFTVVLTAAPIADVILPVMTSDTTEGTTSLQTLIFTPANWNVYQTVTVLGVDDSIDDGDIAYAVVVGPSTSSDVNFNALPGKNVSLVNYDNEDTVVPPTTTGGGRSGGGGSGGPCIGFGCPTSTVVTPVVTTAVNFCPVSDFIVSYMRKGSQNDPNEVRKLQWFLNAYENTNLVINGTFDDATEQAVKLLQSRHSDEILAPWNVSEPTGIVYITTSSYINRFFCKENPLYKAGDLDTRIQITAPASSVIDVIDNSGDFEGAIGVGTTSASSTNPFFGNIAGVFGAFSAGVLNFLGGIPWYPLIIALLILTGFGFIMRAFFIRGTMNTGLISRMSFIQGVVALASGTVLNVLNIVSFMKDPRWFLDATGLGSSWVLSLGLLNLLAVFIICVAFLVRSHVDSTKGSR